jgi:hypothetical protein
MSTRGSIYCWNIPKTVNRYRIFLGIKWRWEFGYHVYNESIDGSYHLELTFLGIDFFNVKFPSWIEGPWLRWRHSRFQKIETYRHLMRRKLSKD